MVNRIKLLSKAGPTTWFPVVVEFDNRFKFYRYTRYFFFLLLPYLWCKNQLFIPNFWVKKFLILYYSKILKQVSINRQITKRNNWYLIKMFQETPKVGLIWHTIIIIMIFAPHVVEYWQSGNNLYQVTCANIDVFSGQCLMSE